jgi:hypothetical protein
MRRLIVLLSAVLALAGADPLRADSILLNSGTGVLGGVAFNRGYDFTVGSTPLTVTALGLWDGPEFSAQGTVIGSVGDGFSSEHFVGLWDNSGNLLAKAVMQLGTLDTLVGEFRYSSTLIVTNPGPLILSAGTTYVLGAAYVQNDPDAVKFDNSSQVSVDPAVTSGNQRTSSGGFSFPANVTNPGAIVGPNALFTVGANGVPDSGNTFSLMLFALGSFFVMRRVMGVPLQKLADRS